MRVRDLVEVLGQLDQDARFCLYADEQGGLCDGITVEDGVVKLDVACISYGVEIVEIQTLV